jgi:hypothetical protein
MLEVTSAWLDVVGWSFGRFSDEIGSPLSNLSAFLTSDHRDGPASLRWSTYAQLRARELAR